jgi:hypothetical protein
VALGESKDPTMKSYQPLVSRPAWGAAAVALTALTMAALVVLPAHLASSPAGPVRATVARAAATAGAGVAGQPAGDPGVDAGDDRHRNGLGSPQPGAREATAARRHAHAST